MGEEGLGAAGGRVAARGEGLMGQEAGDEERGRGARARARAAGDGAVGDGERRVVERRVGAAGDGERRVAGNGDWRLGAGRWGRRVARGGCRRRTTAATAVVLFSEAKVRNPLPSIFL
ncbi:hypothetical protein Salat_1490200 [Sesamum alatum]|uniref:Uncharacterized protein n=1 Tax=Sesamum alatum TaxID=300844 RepID=A0AAE1YCS8_9LAMI|nr:hypothetical protein Salat_1490200 [Sesamum alatum]